jgi:hypothetical protein
MEDSTLMCIGNRHFMILGNHNSENRETLKCDILTGQRNSVGHSGISGGQVAYHIRVREKVCPENIGIRTRDPVKSDVPTRKSSIDV